MRDIILHGEVIVSLAALGERIFLATTSNVYELIDGKWRPMEFARHDDDDEEARQLREQEEEIGAKASS